jgi:hypothetical protein
MTKRARLELSYQHRTNDSSLEYLSFSENLGSLQLDILFSMRRTFLTFLALAVSPGCSCSASFSVSAHT